MKDEQLGQLYHTARNAACFRDFKVAAIEILSECAPREGQPDGWKIVPHEPTKEMLEAGREQWERIGYAGDVWQAMYCASPTPERADLTSNVQYQLQMAAICTAALGYWKEGDSIQPDYDTPALRDVAKLYAKYSELHADAGKDAALTNEQIIAIFQDHYTEEPGDAEPGHILPFARAILAANKT